MNIEHFIEVIKCDLSRHRHSHCSTHIRKMHKKDPGQYRTAERQTVQTYHLYPD